MKVAARESRLMPIAHVPSGFEMVLAKGMVCPGSSGGTWGLWFNTTLSDDPASWDGEIGRINELQQGIDPLTDDQRLIRAQMAGFCRLNSLFPESIGMLCSQIGYGDHDVPWRLGCEGRCLLESLGYEGSEVLTEQRRVVLADYASALEGWLEDRRSVSPRERRVAVFLGERDGQEGFASQLLSLVRKDAPSIGSLKALCASQFGEAPTPRPFNCWSCEGSCEGNEEAPMGCMCSAAMVIDAGLLGAGARAHGVPLDERRLRFSRFTQEYVLAHASALNAWLEDQEVGPVLALDTAMFVSTDVVRDISVRVHDALGERRPSPDDRDPAKEWLAACLLKTVASNQRWRKGHELIDDAPGATSWLREPS